MFIIDICVSRGEFETKIVAPNVLLEVKDMAADPSSGV